VDQTYMIFHKMMEIIPPLELVKIDIFIRAFCDPVLDVDRKRVQPNSHARSRRRNASC
jgi:hypothetical protein